MPYTKYRRSFCMAEYGVCVKITFFVFRGLKFYKSLRRCDIVHIFDFCIILDAITV